MSIDSPGLMVKPFLSIRADTETRIGAGHVMRCLALAQAWQDSGGQAGFVMAMGVPVLETRLKSEGMEIFKISAQPGSINDAVQTADLAKKMRANWVVLDGYHFDSTYQRKIKDSSLQLMVVDDMAHLDHYYADIVLNQNIHAEGLKYSFESYTKLLLGTKYVLLRREFLKWRGWNRQIPDVASKVLVTLGGSDPENVTLKVIQALRRIDVPNIEVKIIVGPSNPHLRELQSEIRNLKFKSGILQNVNNIPELMVWADVAVSAGGSTCWELCFMGMPSVILFFAENQRPIAEKLHAIGGAINLGLYDRLTTGEVAVALERLIKEKKMRIEISKCGQNIVDSYGGDRITKIMMSDLSTIQGIHKSDLGIKNSLIPQERLSITIISDSDTWMNDYIPELIKKLGQYNHTVSWKHNISEINGGDLVFFLGYGQLVPIDILFRNKHNLVVHESALPQGKGWSPLTWQILEGKNEIPITLFEAVESVDSGKIYLQDIMRFNGLELVKELRQKQAEYTIRLCVSFVESYPEIIGKGMGQTGASTFYRRRKPEESKLDPDKTIREQFNLLRVVDNERYPAYFEINNEKFIIKIEKESRK